MLHNQADIRNPLRYVALHRITAPQFIRLKKQSLHLSKPCQKFLFKEEYTIFLFHNKGFSLTNNIKDNRCQQNQTLNNLLQVLVNTHNTHT